MSILPSKADWQNIDTILLDMDGTILDLAYDNYFWLEHVPEKYAEKNKLDIHEAKTYVIDAIQSKRGTLDWYCTDYWSDAFDLNIKKLKHDIRHRVRLLDETLEFLEWAAANKRVIMATNSHRDGLEVKLSTCKIEKYFDRLVTSHDYGHPKEEQAFWTQLCHQENIQKERALFVDDNADVLSSAKQFGIAYIAGIEQADYGNIPNLNALLARM